MDDHDRQEGADENLEEGGGNAGPGEEGSETELDDDSPQQGEEGDDPESEEDEEGDDPTQAPESQTDDPEANPLLGEGTEERTQALTDRLEKLKAAKGETPPVEGTTGDPAKPPAKPVVAKPEEKKKPAAEGETADESIFTEEELAELGDLVSPVLAKKLKQVDILLAEHRKMLGGIKEERITESKRKTIREVNKWFKTKGKTHAAIVGVEGKLTDAHREAHQKLFKRGAELQDQDNALTVEDALDMALIEFMAKPRKPGQKPMKEAIQASRSNRSVAPGKSRATSNKDARTEAVKAASAFYQS